MIRYRSLQRYRYIHAWNPKKEPGNFLCGPNLVVVVGGACPYLRNGAVGGVAIVVVETLSLVLEGNAFVVGVVPGLGGDTRVALPNLQLSARCGSVAGVEAVVGARNLDGGGTRCNDPVLCASSVTVVARRSQSVRQSTSSKGIQLTYPQGYRWP